MHRRPRARLDARDIRDGRHGTPVEHAAAWTPQVTTILPITPTPNDTAISTDGQSGTVAVQAPERPTQARKGRGRLAPLRCRHGTYPQEQGCRSVGRRHPLRPWRRSTRACRSILRSQRFSSGRSCGTLRPKSPFPCWSGDPQVPVALGPISRRASDPSRSQDRTWMLSGSGAGTGSAS